MDHDSPLLQAFVYLAAALITVPIAKRIGLGSVPGYVIAGAAMGPYGLKLLGAPGEVMHVAEFGVVIMLFLIGLEMTPSLLWRLRAAIVGLGAAQMAATGLAFSAAGLAAGLDWRAAVACGFILALSSTAIALQSLRERSLGDSAPGRAAFAVLLFQDIAVIPLLALLPLLASRAAPPADTPLALLPAWAQGVATIAAVGAVILIGRVAMRPLFRFIAETGLREIFTMAALAIVIGVAVLMQAVGLSPALGAFIAGVVLAESEFRHEIESDIEPFRGLLLGLFFITVGASIDFALLAAQPALIAGLVAGLLTLKAAIMFALARITRLNGKDALVVALATAQGGEFAFVLLALATGLGVITGARADLLIAVVALSMAATPLLFLVGDRITRYIPKPEERPYEEIESDRPHALIAGFGRFGQVVGRLLIANGYRTSVLDSSASQIDLLRGFGQKVNYGDASRVDLLRAAGAETAKIFVIAVDDQEKALEIAEDVRRNFPHLTILARAYDRNHAYELRKHGAETIERETFEGALRLGVKALRALGQRALQAERAGGVFRRHDERLFEGLAPYYGKDEYRERVREARMSVDQLLQRDLGLYPSANPSEAAWDTASLDRENAAERGGG
jgi:glutathione-regulated potassium-efflux system ancillary protein KefC/glutathione-regulated potassium-efflux system protein KefB